MRVSGLLCAAAWVACLLPATSSAQSTAQRRAAAVTASEEQTEPYHKHRDIRHGHDHYYPDRGAIVRDLPVGTIGTSYAGVSYRYHDGIWLEPRGPAYMVVAPPVGLVAPTLPLYSTVVTHGSDSFLYCNDTYYRPRPDLGGYEVVNDPAMETGPAPPAEPEALVGGRMPSAPAAGALATGAPAVGAGAAGAVGAAALVGGTVPFSTATAGPTAGAVQLSTAAAGPTAGAVQLSTAAAGPTAGAVVPAVAREAVPRESSFSGGAMPGANTGSVRLAAAASGGDTSASGAATPSTASVGVAPPSSATPSSTTPSSAPPSSATPSSATPSSGAAAASVPAASLGTSAGTSASVAPAGAPAAGTQKVPRVFLYPKNGQSADQQARDRYDCYRFAVAQSGFDPLRTTGSAPAPASEPQSDFERAQGACFEGRGYSNR